MNLLDIYKQEGAGDSEPFVVALVDDPADGQTLLVIMFESEGHTAVFDFDSLIEREDIEPMGPSLSARAEAELREQIGWD